MPSSKTCIALLAEGTEELELIGTVDLLRRAGIDVTIAGLEGSGCYRCAKNVSLCADAALSDVVQNDFDIVFVPGGSSGVSNFSRSDLVKDLLTKQDSANRIIAAICAGPTVLKYFSLAHGKTVTSYPSVSNEFIGDENYTYSEDKVVIDGNIITSRGPGTVIDFGLAIISELFGEETRAKVAKSLVYE